MKKSKYFKYCFWILTVFILLNILIFYKNTSDKDLSNKELRSKIKLLIQEGESDGIKLNNFQEKELYLCSNDELTDFALDLMFAIECQKEVNEQKYIETSDNRLNNMLNISEDSILRSNYSEYITRQAGKVYSGTKTLNLNGTSKNYTYQVNVYADYCYRAYTDYYSDAATSFYALRSVTSTRGMGGSLLNIKSYNNNAGYLANNWGSSFEVIGYGKFLVESRYGNLSFDVPYEAKFYCGDGSYITSSPNAPNF